MYLVQGEGRKLIAVNIARPVKDFPLKLSLLFTFIYTNPFLFESFYFPFKKQKFEN